MKKGRGKNRNPLVSAAPADKEYVHFRLCHVCLHLNEAASEIFRCERCLKYLSYESGWESPRPGEKKAHRATEEDDESFNADPIKRLVLTGLSVLW